MENKAKRVKSAYWRIVIPHLQQLSRYTSAQLFQLKQSILEKLLTRQRKGKRYLQYYRIALEKHQTGIYHLDILLAYQKSIQHRLTEYDYLFKHGNITTYRRLNDAIIDYGNKQDKQNLSNFPENTSAILDLQRLKQDPYRYLELQMLKDPLNFNLQQYCHENDIAQHVKSYSVIKGKLKDMQLAAANISLRSKPGFKLITQDLIDKQLSKAQKELYYGSWNGYRRIVHYLNQIVLKGGYRQMKTLNLLITGSPSIGKTSLFHNPSHSQDQSCVEDFTSVYPMGMTTWFPQYKTGVYKLILWNQAKLTSYSYDTILKLLEGSYLDLPTKGSVSPKRDNPLIVMTSNLTLDQLIEQKFRYDQNYMRLARANLAVRVQNVIVPYGYNLFLLQKLLIAA